MRVLVTGAGGFIGGHLVRRLVSEGHEVRGVDIKPLDEWFQPHPEHISCCWELHDLREADSAMAACAGIDWVFNLAADMGGMGFIENNKADCMLSVLINTNMLRAARAHNVQRYFFSSSACVYPGYRQNVPAHDFSLKENMAYPADPEDGYGWEKLFSERMCRHFWEDFALPVRIARYHNVYGPYGTWDGGREKAPAAICRKVAQAVISKNLQIEIWGDGQQQRSFMYIDDCIEGTMRLMNTAFNQPLNIGSSEVVTINQMVDIVEEIAGCRLWRSHKMDAPQGVRGRNSDNSRIKKFLGWEPSTSLIQGLDKTYAWVYDQVKNG